MVIVPRARVREGDPKVQRQAPRRIYMLNDGETICTTPEETGKDGIDNEDDEDGMVSSRIDSVAHLAGLINTSSSPVDRGASREAAWANNRLDGESGWASSNRREDWINGCGADSRRLVQRLGAIHWCRQERPPNGEQQVRYVPIQHALVSVRSLLTSHCVFESSPCIVYKTTALLTIQ